MTDVRIKNSVKIVAAFVPVIVACLYIASIGNPWLALAPLSVSLVAAIALTVRSAAALDVESGFGEIGGQLKAIRRSQAVIEFSMDGTIQYANDNFLTAMGYRLDEVKGQHHRIFVEPEYAASHEYRDFWDSLRRGEYVAAEFRRVAKDGSDVWIQASYNPILDVRGNPIKVVKFATDITERKLKAADHAGQVEAIAKSQAVIEFSLDGTILNANANFLDTMGYRLGEIQGQHHRLFVEPEYGESAEYRAFWDKLSRGEYQAAEFKRVAKDGSDVWIQASYNPIFDPDGRPFKVVKYATDVTNRRLASANYQGQLEAISKSQAVIEFDLDGHILSANDNFLGAMGYRLDEIVGQHHSLFVESGYAASAEYNDFWERLRRGEYDSAEFKRVAKDGSDVWIQASYNPILDPDGRPFKVVKYAIDITKQRLKAADYEGQIEAIGKSQAVVEFDLDGTILDANENFLSAMGYRLDEVKGKHHRVFVDADYAASAEYRAFWDKLRRGEYDAAEFKRVAKDGSDVWIQASYNPIFDPDGVPFKVVKYATDITEQRLKAADYEGQIEAIGKAQAVIEFELDGTVLNVNEIFLSTMGYKRDEVVGKHHRMFVEQEFAESPAYDSLWSSLRRGESRNETVRLLTKSGELLWIQASYNPIVDLNGKPFKVVNYATDVTEQRRLADENAIIRKSLENVTSSVMVADNSNTIMYLNATALELFNGAEAEVRQDLPNFRAAGMLGSSIDDFHKDPSHQQRMIADMRTSFRSNVTLGGRKFALAASPLFDGETRLGTVLEWIDRTQEILIESEVEDVVQNALRGDLTQRIDVDGKDGFIATLSQGVNQLVGICERVIDDTVRVMSAIADGNLNESIESDYQGSFDTLKVGANSTVSKLTEVVSKIQTTSSSVKSGAGEISQGNTDLSQRTEEQASSLEETASSMEEMTSTVRQNADNAAQANQLAQAARTQAEKGGNVVNDAVRAMAEINSSSKKISDIIGVIDEIAFQTNLLALNASVEAARAGDQGRGFAVVASEVRNLAGRSATAAKEIKDLIKDSGSKVDEGSRLVNESGETLEEIVSGVKKVTDIVGEIAAASQEQAAGIDEVNNAITQMDELTQQNAALVEEAAAASASLGEQADSLTALVAFFNVDSSDLIAEQSQYKGVDRRSSSRPWSPEPAPSNQESVTQPVVQQAVANGDDSEWKEF